MSRIKDLPRRDWTDGADEIARELAATLRGPYGAMSLRPIQAVALLEASELGGLFCNARVGAGKTLISFLAPVVMGARRPLLLISGGRRKREATEAIFRELAKHWRSPEFYRIESYGKLSTVRAADLLENYQPDLIVADEAQKLKHLATSVATRRIARYRADHAVRIVLLSGSLTRGSILDYAHLLEWALGDGAPIPRDQILRETWAAALDADPLRRLDDWTHLRQDLGDCVDEHGARDLYRDRLLATPGVVVSTDGFDGPLTTAAITLDPPATLDGPFRDLRTLWRAPDGWLLADARFEVWAMARQLALGFYERHDPWPPEVWFEKRRAWCKAVRTVIEHSDLDSELQVAQAADAGKLGGSVELTYLEWREIEPSFKIHKVPTWFSDHAIEAAAKWGKGGGVIWTDHVPFAERLAERTGWTHFGGQGVDREQRYIEHVTDRTIIASAQANGVMVNLQYQWHRALMTSPPTGADDWEQRIGRIHRDGQTRPVHVDFFLGCHEHVTAIGQSMRRAEYAIETLGQPQKILDAPLIADYPSSRHPAWDVTTSSKE